MGQIRAVRATAGLIVAAAAYGCATKRLSIHDVMQQYCKAPDANQHWCKSEDIPAVQKWEIVDGYCADVPNAPRRRVVTNPSDEVCKAFATAQHPFALIYDMRRKTWSGNDAFKRRAWEGAVDLTDPTGRPAVYLAKGKELGVVIEQVNPAAYRVERGETTVRDIEGLQSIQAVLTAAGGALGSLASISALTIAGRKGDAVESADVESADVESAIRLAMEKIDSVQAVVPQEAIDRELSEAEDRLKDHEFDSALRSMGSVAEKLQASNKRIRDKAMPDLRDAREAVLAAHRAALEAEQRRISIDEALKKDLALIKKATGRVKDPLAEVESHVERLDTQLRRVQAIGRELNGTAARIGREFDSDVEQAATWTKLFETLRRASDEADAGIAGCKTLLEKYQAVIAANADKPVEVQVAAIDFRRELAMDSNKIRSSCALPNLQVHLDTAVTRIAKDASELSLRPSSETVANAGPLRAAQAAGRNMLGEPTGILLRQTAAFAAALQDVNQVLGKETNVKKQAAVSAMLTERIRDASLKKFGGAPSTSYSCGAPLNSESAMSLEVIKSPAEDESVKVEIVLYKGAQQPTVSLSIPDSAKAGDDIPIGITDVDYYNGCSKLTVIVNDQIAAERAGDVKVIVHPSYVVANRLFVHERPFQGRLTKVQTDKFVVSLSQPKDLELVVDGPDKVEATYDVSRRQGPLFGANLGVIYTPVFSRTFALVDPTPAVTVSTTQTEERGTTKEVTTFLEKKRVEEQSRDTRAGQVAGFLNLRLLQALVPQTARLWVKPGVEVGFGVDATKPSILTGVSLEVFRYLRVGFGRAWVSTTDAKDPAIVGKDVDANFVVPVETKFRKTWYASVTFALDALTLFPGK